MNATRHEWTPGHRPSGLGRWQGTDERLAAALDNAIGSGCCDEAGDVDGPGWYALVPYSHRPGGYVVHVDTYGFHDARHYGTTEALQRAWDRIETRCEEWYDEADDEGSADA